jgi:hypothetical protein
MAYLVLAAIAFVTWATVRAVPARNPLMRAGVGCTVAGGLTTLFMWWMVIPEVILAAGLAMLVVGWVQSRSVQAT